MQDRPSVAIDFFCGHGGVTRALLRHFDHVIGIDNDPTCRKHYLSIAPRRLTFICADAVNVLERLALQGGKVRVGEHALDLKNVDFLWASPPCQHHTAMKHAPGALGEDNPDFIPQTRIALRTIHRAVGMEYVIENVEGAPLRDPVMLCGSHFGLHAITSKGRRFNLERHRLFEASFPIPQPRCRHAQPVIGVYGGHARCRSATHGGRGTVDFKGESQRDLAAQAMGIDGMTLAGMSEAIPPKYVQHIMKALNAL